MTYNLSFNPQWTQGGAMDPTGYSSPYGGGATIYDFLMGMQKQQPTGAQSIAYSLPQLGLPKKQQAYFQPAFNDINAMTDTNNPEYQRIYGQQKAQGQQNLAESIAELQRQNRKASLLGRTPLFGAERGGETLFRGLTQGYQNTQNQAAYDTRNILGDSANRRMQAAGIQSQIAANKASNKGTLQSALMKLFGL